MRGPSLLYKSGMSRVAAATVASALLGCTSLVVAARELGAAEYANFSVLWSLFFAVGGVCAGLQQEVTRSVSTLDQRREHHPRMGVPAVGATVALAGAVALVASVVVSTQREGRQGAVWWSSVAPVLGLGVLALASYTAVCGVLAAREEWTWVAQLVTFEPAARLIGVVVACSIGASAPALMAAIAFPPFVVLLMVVGPVRTAMAARMGETFASYCRRGGLLMAANGCVAMLIAGFPFLVRITGSQTLGGHAGALFAAIVVTRAPLLLPLNGFRLPILVDFSRHRDILLHRMVLVLAIVIGATIVGSLVAAAIGPFILRLILGPRFAIDPLILLTLTVSAGLVAIMTVTGLALVSIRAHAPSTLGWAAALGTAVVALSLTLPITQRCVLGLLLGPAVGVALHMASLVILCRSPRLSNVRVTARRLTLDGNAAALPDRCEVSQGMNPHGTRAQRRQQ